jgi:hypothetical protein
MMHWPILITMHKIQRDAKDFKETLAVAGQHHTQVVRMLCILLQIQQPNRPSAAGIHTHIHGSTTVSHKLSLLVPVISTHCFQFLETRDTMASGWSAKATAPSAMALPGLGGLTMWVTLPLKRARILLIRYGEPANPPTTNITLMCGT